MSCGDTNSTNRNPGLTGNIAGYIYLADTSGLQRGSAGITLSIASTQYSTMTDSSGKWTFNNLPIGTYDIRASKPGYGKMHWFGIKVTGFGTYYVPSTILGEIPSYEIILDSARAQANGSPGIYLFGRVIGLNQSTDGHLCIDIDSTIQPDEPHLVQPVSVAELQSTVWSCNIDRYRLQGVSSGTRVFLSMYGGSSGGYEYYHPTSGQKLPINPSKKSNSLPFIIP
jgi:hypothetical protein